MIRNITKKLFYVIKEKENLPVSYHYYSYQKIYLKKEDRWINRPTFTYRNTAMTPYEGVEYYREFLPYRGNIASIYLNGERLVKIHNNLHLFIFEKFLVNLEIALDTLPINDKERKKKNKEALSLWYDHTVCFHYETWPEDFENWKGIYFHARAKNIHLKCKYREEITLLIDAVKKIRNKLEIGSLFHPNPDLAYNDYATKETWQNIYSFTTEDFLGIPFIAEEEFRTRNFSQNELYGVHFPALIPYLDEMYDNLMKIKDHLPTNDEWSLIFLLKKRWSLKKESLGSYWYHFKSHLKERGNKKNFILGTTKRIAIIIVLTFLRPLLYPVYLFLLFKKKNKGWRVSFPTLKAYLLDKWYKYQSFNIERDIYHITNRLKSGLFNIFIAFPIRLFLFRYVPILSKDLFIPPLSSMYMVPAGRKFSAKIASETAVSHAILSEDQKDINQSTSIPQELKPKIKKIALEHIIFNHMQDAFSSTITLAGCDGNSQIHDVMVGKPNKFLAKNPLSIADLPEIKPKFPFVQPHQLGRDPLTRNFPGSSFLSELISANIILNNIDIDRNNFLFRSAHPKEINNCTPDLIIEYRDKDGKWKKLGVEIRVTEQEAAAKRLYREKIFATRDMRTRNIPIIDTSANVTPNTVFDITSIDNDMRKKILPRISNNTVQSILITDKNGNLLTQVDIRNSDLKETVPTKSQPIIEKMGETLRAKTKVGFDIFENTINTKKTSNFSPGVNFPLFQQNIGEINTYKLLDDTLATLSKDRKPKK